MSHKILTFSQVKTVKISKKNGSQRCSTETVTVLAPALTAIWAD